MRKEKTRRKAKEGVKKSVGENERLQGREKETGIEWGKVKSERVRKE